MTLLQEIQTETSSSGGDLATILRKCKILAARLGSEEFAQWITWELDGYPDDQGNTTLPAVRGAVLRELHRRWMERR